ncbi:hypothetical protein [Candidatus Electrothrix sp.]|uniref:hypothetical protein n=1 Tax=Candidatus Electrothrix sp. TaxID=2170559 RepID=UPI0040570F55
MKKLLFYLCCLLFLGALSYFFFYYPVPPDNQQSYYADFLPEDTVALVSLYGMKDIAENFPRTSLGHFFSQPNMHEMMRELGATDEDLYTYDAFYQSIADMMTSPLLTHIFGDDAIITLFPPDVERLEEDPEQEVKNALLVFATSSTAGSISTLASIALKSVTNIRISGLKMTRIILNEEEEGIEKEGVGEEVIYGYDDQGIIMLAYDPERIVAAVQHKAGKDNLRHTDPFLATEAFWQEEAQKHIYVRLYCNMPLLEEFFAALPQQKSQERATRPRSLRKFAGVEGMGGMVIEEQGKLRLRIQGKIDNKLLPKVFPKVLSHGSLEEVTLPLLREDTLFHYRIADFDKAFVRGFLSLAKAKSQYKELKKTVQKNIGFSLDKLLEAVGPHAGVSVQGLVNAGIFPLPKTVFAFQVQDKKAAGRALRKVRDAMKKQGLYEDYEKIQGQRLYYWSMMPIEATHLAIALTDTMLYIANGESQLRALLAEKADPEALTEKMVKELGTIAGACVRKANVSAFLLRPRKLADHIAPVVGWLTDMTLASQAGSGKKTQKEVLALLRSVDGIAGCSERTATDFKGELIIQHEP